MVGARIIRPASVVIAALAALVLAATQAFAAPPTVTAVSPNSGSTSGQSSLSCTLNGPLTIITGTNFTAPATVTMGGTSATNVTVDNANQIRVCAPVGVPGVANVTVTTVDGSGTGANLYTY